MSKEDNMNLVAKVILDIKDFLNGVKEIKDGFKEVSDESKNSSNDVEEAGKKMNDSLKKTPGTIKQIIDKLFSLKTLIGTMVAKYGGKKLFDFTLGGATEFEQYETQFKVFLKSSEAAQRRMEELNKFAIDTPYQLPEIIQAARMMDTFKFYSTDMLETIGDAAYFAMTNIEDVAYWMGRLKSGNVGQALMRLTQMGLVTRTELEGRGIEFDKNGAYRGSIEKVWNEVISIMKEKSQGMMVEQSKTAKGLTSVLSDDIEAFGRDIGKYAFEDYKGIISDLIGTMDRLRESGQLDEYAQKIGSALAFVVEVIANLIQWIVGLIVNMETLIQTFQDAPAWVHVLVGALTGLFIAQQLIALFQMLSEAIKGLAIAQSISGFLKVMLGVMKQLFIARDVAGAINMLKVALQGLSMTNVVGIIMTIVGALIALIMRSNEAREVFSNMLKGMADALNKWGNWIEQRLGILGKIIGKTVKAGAGALDWAGDLVAPKEPEEPDELEVPDLPEPDLPEPYTIEFGDSSVGKTSKEKKKDIVDIIDERYSPLIKKQELKNSIGLTDLELKNIGKDTKQYKDTKEFGIREVLAILQNQMIELKAQIPKLRGEVKDKAEIRLLELQERSNKLLLDIKENTAKMVGEFNKPGGIKPMTLYESRLGESNTKSVLFNNAKFLFQVDKINNVQDAQRALSKAINEINGKYMNEVERF